MTLLGKRVFGSESQCEMILDNSHGLKNPTSNVLTRKRQREIRDIRRRLGDDGGRDWREAATRQEPLEPPEVGRTLP